MATRPVGEQPPVLRQAKQAPPSAPWSPPKTTLAQTMAAKAVSAGNANPEQQKRFMEWLIREVCRYSDIEFRPGTDGDRAAAFAGGKRFVAAMVVKEIEIQLPARGGTENG
jgi:hypothetical protein